jgi:hypothetical protein
VNGLFSLYNVITIVLYYTLLFVGLECSVILGQSYILLLLLYNTSLI